MLWMEPPHVSQQGDHIYRTRQPGKALAKVGGFSISNESLVHPHALESLRNSQLLLLCDTIDIDMLPALQHRITHHLPFIYEINDSFTNVQHWNPTTTFYQNELNQSLIQWAAHKSNLLQFSMPHLQELYGYLNPNQVVFPNHLLELPKTQSPTNSSCINIGWGGSWGHRDDLLSILPCIRDLLLEIPELTFSLMGAEAFKAILKSELPEGRWKYTPQNSLEKYYDFLSTLHIGIAPLLDTEFNRCRSDIKFLEYAGHGVVPIVSDLAPYQMAVENGKTGFVYGSPTELSQQIKRLIENPNLRREIQTNCRSYVAKHRIENLNVEQRANQYCQLRGSPPPTNQSTSNEFVSLPYGNLEKSVIMGLSQSPQNIPPAALQLIREGAGHHYWCDYLVEIKFAAPETLQNNDFQSFLERYPQSIRGHWDYVTHLDSRNACHLDAALHHLMRLFPAFPLSFEKLSNLYETKNNLSEARQLRKNGIRANPFYRPLRRALAIQEMEVREFSNALNTLGDENPTFDWNDFLLQAKIHRQTADLPKLQQSLHAAKKALEKKPSHIGLTELAREALDSKDKTIANWAVQMLKS